MTCLGVLERGERGNGNQTGLKEGGLIEMSTTVLHSRAALSHYFIFLIFEQNIFTIITTSIVTQSTTFQLFDLLVYTVWACLKAMTI